MSAALTASLLKAIISGIVEVFVFAYVMTNCSNKKSSSKTTSTKHKSKQSKQIHSKDAVVPPPSSDKLSKDAVKHHSKEKIKIKEKEQPPTSHDKEQQSSNVVEEKPQVVSMEPKIVPRKKDQKESPKGATTAKTEFTPDNDLKSRTNYNIPPTGRTSVMSKGRTIHTKDHKSDIEEQISSDKMVDVDNGSQRQTGSTEPVTHTAGESSTNMIQARTAVTQNETSGVEARDKEKGFVEV